MAVQEPDFLLGSQVLRAAVPLRRARDDPGARTGVSVPELPGSPARVTVSISKTQKADCCRLVAESNSQSLPKSEPRPPLLLLSPPWVCSGTVGPSEGCMRTQPGPSKAIWKVSPLPRPIKVLNETSERTLVRTPPLHAIAESGSAKVGVLVSSSTGLRAR